MPIKPIHLILLLTILLAGCAPAAAADTPTPLPSRTPAPPSPTPSKTSFWRIITSTITPTPTISPTITMTPSLPFNACPATDEEYRYPFPDSVDSTQELTGHILEALNNGITLSNLKDGVAQVVNENICCWEEQIEDEYGRPQPYQLENTFTTRDLTGDNVKEIVFIGMTEFIPMMRIVNVFSCKHGNYILSLSHRFHYTDDLEFLDLNNNDISEVILHLYADPMHGPNLLYIYEWDGKNFRNLIPQEYWYEYEFPGAYVTYAHSWVEDYLLNYDGTYDVLIRGIPGDFGEVVVTGPYRYYSIALSWDGTHFTPGNSQLEPPTYRFQAVQDGDRESLRGNFEKALAFYNQALNDPYLKGWSEKIYRQQHDALGRSGLPTLTPYPVDPNEIGTLTAYIYYRKMLIYSAQGKHEEALTEYLDVMKLTPGQPGYAYKGLAIIFWKKYQTTQDLAAACIKTQIYAHENYDEIFNPIDRNWHGWQSPGYYFKPLICPFGEIEEETPTPRPTQTATQEYWPSN